jgi:S-DNA-T family DNA segregation ATPase FtsK/SpoIIIE
MDDSVEFKANNFKNILDEYNIKYEDVRVFEHSHFDYYDIYLKKGFRISKIKSQLQDIGASLKTKTEPSGTLLSEYGVYRIEAQKSSLDKIDFNTLWFEDSNIYSPMLIGIDKFGNTILKDLNSIPNLLIAGIPGSGKSVLLHSIILSQIKSGTMLYLVDPKMVEFNIYSDIKNVKYIATSIKQTYELLNKVRDEMESRFKLLAESICRNVNEFYIKHKKRLRPISIIIDEWADLVLQDQNIQKLVSVIAQKGRAAGISIILATQRPSSKVISGLIKANFPGRICMRVSSALESRVVLDKAGAQLLSGVGEGLYMDNTNSEPLLFKAVWLEKPEQILNKIPNVKKTFWDKLWQ